MMLVKLPFELKKALCGEAGVEIPKSPEEVFAFVGERFFENYPRWALEVIDFQVLDGNEVFVGAKAVQVKIESGTEVRSTFQITDYLPGNKLSLEGIDGPYRQHYLIENTADDQPTRLVFRFELLDLEVFMRPFEKLIRYAIEEGAENTVANIRSLLLNPSETSTPTVFE